MRLTKIALAAAVALLGSRESVAAANMQQAKVTTKVDVDHEFQTRSLAVEQNIDAFKRSLRTTGASGTIDDEDIGESSFLEKTKFYYWYSMGRTPGYVYDEFFQGMEKDIVVKNPTYKEWQRYKAYYEEKTGA
ncbi:RxLR effector protein [Phytophthora megakarya]|uniref:RxLR effector protein n=1 Tax=Phytophthora megakarya TaxID=4795 RepID=A0A225WBI1_9STRA|nr:RxLR effector protein [Phytophthora megakarya]